LLLKLLEIGLLEIVVIYCMKFYLEEGRKETAKYFGDIIL